MIQFFTDNWQAILLALLSIEASARLVAKLTPTKADDDFLDKVDSALISLGVKKPNA